MIADLSFGSGTDCRPEDARFLVVREYVPAWRSKHALIALCLACLQQIGAFLYAKGVTVPSANYLA